MNYTRVLLLSMIGILAASFQAAANTEVSGICDRSAHVAAREINVPVKALLAITRVETGRAKGGALQPWPWTVNMEGKGVWFPNKRDALDYARTHFQNGARSFDIGCFQINYRWHHGAFTSIEHMFDPEANAVYAAKFLKSLHQETGDWTKAAGAYHSRTPTYAKKYSARFKKILATVRTTSAPSMTEPKKIRQNNFPLLQGQIQRSELGSLMPTQHTSAKPFWKG